MPCKQVSSFSFYFGRRKMNKQQKPALRDDAVDFHCMVIRVISLNIVSFHLYFSFRYNNYFSVIVIVSLILTDERFSVS